MDASAVVSFLRHYVAYFLFAGNPPYGPLFHERLWWGRRFAQPSVSENQPYSDDALGDTLSVYLCIHLVFDADPCQQFCGPYQLCSAHFHGDFYSLVPELVSGESCQREILNCGLFHPSIRKFSQLIQK